MYIHFYPWYKRKSVIYKKIEIDIYDDVFVSALSKFMKDNMDISNIPEDLICIDYAKLSIYKYPTDAKTSESQKKTIEVFCIVKEIERDNIVYYEGWDPKSRGKSKVLP